MDSTIILNCIRTWDSFTVQCARCATITETYRQVECGVLFRLLKMFKLRVGTILAWYNDVPRLRIYDIVWTTYLRYEPDFLSDSVSVVSRALFVRLDRTWGDFLLILTVKRREFPSRTIIQIEILLGGVVSRKIPERRKIKTKKKTFHTKQDGVTRETITCVVCDQHVIKR